ncbi:hypothetical protein [Bdellovibrio sp. HCB337]|uniref:hypothetical protein n=1 Tax=Bdellovibrio sp. HCB337 TaxID=3394358 RepID=UPI0039A75538
MLPTTTQGISMVRIGNSQGNFSVIAIIAMISCVLLLYLVHAITPLLSYKRQVVAANIKTNLVLAMENIKTTLNNTQAIKTIVNLPENAPIKCIAQATCTYNMSPQTLKVVGLDGTLLSDGSSVGIDHTGQPCSTTSGESKCLFTIVVRWRPLCPADGSVCVNPPVEITSETSFSGGLMKFVLNFNNVNFKFRLTGLAAQITP